MNVLEAWEPLVAAGSVIVVAAKLATALAAWLPWSQLVGVACSSTALGWVARGIQSKRRWKRIFANNCDAFIQFTPQVEGSAVAGTQFYAHRAACVKVVEDAILRARFALRSRSATDPEAEQLFSLMDAIHKLPAAITDPDPFWDKARVLNELALYDQRVFFKALYPATHSLQATYEKTFAAHMAPSPRSHKETGSVAREAPAQFGGEP